MDLFQNYYENPKEMNKTSRRDFIRISSLSTAALFAGGKMAGRLVAADDIKGGTKYFKTPTYCEVCFWKCAGWIYTDKEGEIWKVVGNENDPMCNGRLCPRGTGGVGMYHDKDRLKVPMIRREIDGKHVFEETSWEEALAYVSRKMNAIKAEHGAESLALFNHGSGGNHFTNLLKGFGSSNITAPSYAQCRGPREVGFELTFGDAVNSPEPVDIENADCLVLIGSHLGENMHNSQVQEMSTLIDRKATIITVDPRLSTVASHSTHWLPIKPATDIALLLAWMNVIIEKGVYDKEYVERYCTGFEELKAHVADKTPEWASEITNLPASQIRETALVMAMKAPATLVHPGRHVTWYGDDTQRVRCIAILNAILGSYGRKGGFFFPQSIGLAGFPHPAFPVPKWTWTDLITDRFTFAGSSVANTFIDASHPDNTSDKKLKGWFVVGTNLIHTIPDQNRTLEAIQNLDLLVVVDTMPTDITGYADVVLPECTYIERSDHPRVVAGKRPSVALRLAAAKPKYRSKPSSWIARKLGIKLGLQGFFMYDEFEEVVKYQIENSGLSYEKIRREGVITITASDDLLFLKEGEDRHFNTPSGKIELYSKQLADAGHDPIPQYTAHPQPEDGYYRLNYGRAPMHTFTRTANNPNLADIMDTNTLWISPKVAKRFNLSDGQEVWLKNQDDVVSLYPISVRITERMGVDNVYMVHGFGHNDMRLSRAGGKGISDTQLITNVMVDPIMGGTGMRGNFVTFLTTEP